jgi:hypothetical protein
VVVGPEVRHMKRVAVHPLVLVSVSLARIIVTTHHEFGFDIDFVDSHPQSFTNAYFDFASIRVYE